MQERVQATDHRETGDLAAKCHEAQAQLNRSTLTTLDWEHEKESVQRHTSRLNEETHRAHGCSASSPQIQLSRGDTFGHDIEAAHAGWRNASYSFGAVLHLPII